ncbi:MAG: YqeG family HAD IIIA-type phosphatase [Thermotogae bacterium]|nr:YqeG family HAD IIIA-type phosphatase [Thermotogota bacterium]
MNQIVAWLKRLIPKQEANDIHNIDYDSLIKLGFKAFLFDYDNTLAPWRSIEVDERTLGLFEELLNRGLKVAVVTNAPRSRAVKIIERFGNKIPVFGNMGKPRIKKFEKVFETLHVKPEECVIIGDLFFTDIIAGNKLNMHTIMVVPREAKGFIKQAARITTQIMYFVVFYTIGWFFRTIYLLSPNEIYNNVFDVDYVHLKQHGIKLIIFDYDNTLAKWRNPKPNSKIFELLTKLKNMGFKIIIFSNGKNHRFARLREILKNVIIISSAKKPLPFKLRKLLKYGNIRPSEAVIIGDQLFTDVLAGNLAGIYTIKVEPLDKSEFFITKILRLLERFFMLFIQEKPKIGGIRS